MIKQIQTTGNIQASGGGRSANAERLNALANLGKKVADVSFGFAAKKRQEQGALEGAQAGIEAEKTGVKPESKSSFFPTMYGQAYDKSQQAAYLASVDTSATERLIELESKFEQDPESFDYNAKGYLDGMLENAPPEYKSQLELSFQRSAASSRVRINQRVKDQVEKETKSSLSNAYDVNAQSRMTAIRNGDKDAARMYADKEKFALDGLVEAGMMTKEEAAAKSEGSERDYIWQDTKQGVLKVAEKDPQKALSQLDELEKTTPNLYTPPQWEGVINDIRADVNRKIEKVSAGTKRAANDWISRTKKVMGEGFVSDEKHLQEGRFLLNQTGQLDVFAQLETKQAAAKMPSAPRKALMLELANSRDNKSQLMYADLKAVDDQVARFAEEDLMSTLVRQGIIPELPPIVDGDLSERRELVDLGKKQYGIEGGVYSMPEIKDFVNSFGSMTYTDKAAFAIGFDDSPSTYQQLDKANAPIFAMVSQRGELDVAENVFRGQELLSTKQFTMPEDSKIMPSLVKAIGAPGELYPIDDRATMIKAIKYHYASIADNDGALDSSAMEKSVLAVTGGIATINGGKIELAKNVSEDDVDDFINNMQPQMLEDLDLMLPIPIDDIRDGRLVSIGPGQYHLFADKALQKNKSGEPLIINLTPELVLRNRVYKPKLGRSRKNR